MATRQLEKRWMTGMVLDISAMVARLQFDFRCERIKESNTMYQLDQAHITK